MIDFFNVSTSKQEVKMEKQVFSKKLRTAVAFLFLCVSLFAFTAQSFSARNVPCKDCGSGQNCQNGNGLNTGYDNCTPILGAGTTEIVGCHIDASGWLNCG
ncbi:hypothetical protein DRQ07_11390 [candidate division KSB1 bacterium]|nr:MAG: hypothetical protein DRQ07_11390 [candidate division KSB1 bacterium]